jgi:dCMP deaminase
MHRDPNWWHVWYLQLAAHVATASKDPSTKTGGVIVRPDKTIASVGFNGFPRKIADTPEFLNNRDEKYKRVIHSEMNAILNARERLDGYTLYNWPGQSCSRCAVHVIQAGISTVVSPVFDPANSFMARWMDDMQLAESLYREAGVTLIHI